MSQIFFNSFFSGNIFLIFYHIYVCSPSISWQFILQKCLASSLSIFVMCLLQQFLASFLAIFLWYFLIFLASCLWIFVKRFLQCSVSCLFPGNAPWFHFWLSSHLCCCGSASGLVTLFITHHHYHCLFIVHCSPIFFISADESKFNRNSHWHLPSILDWWYSICHLHS